MAVIGIDLGGTKITGVLFDENGTILHQISYLLEERKGNEVGRLVLHTIDELPAGNKEVFVLKNYFFALARPIESGFLPILAASFIPGRRRHARAPYETSI